MIFALYRGLTVAAAPLVSLLLRRRLAHGKEDPARLHERMGRPALPRPPGPLVWLHAASIGESVSALPVIERVSVEGGVTVLVTTGTVTSARMLAERLPAGALHQFSPIDLPANVKRFLDHWRPDLALWMESEFWPNMLVETARRRIPIVLLNGRVSARSFQRWQHFPGVIRALLATFSLCLGQSDEDVRRLRALGARTAASLGNLKLAAPPLPADPAGMAALAPAFAGRPAWLAASTHAGEEALAGTVHQALAARHPGLLSVVIPRHAARGMMVAAELRGLGLEVAVRSAGEPVTQATQVYLADTMGELGLFYRLCPVVFVGKSLVGDGGQNPLEPARLGCSVLYGPNMSNFADIAQRMSAAEAGETVPDRDGLTAAVDRLLADPALRLARGGAARAFATAEAGVLDTVLAALAPYLLAARQRHARS